MNIRNYFNRIGTTDIEATDLTRKILKMINLRHLSQDEEYAGYKSPAVFHQRINGYLLGKNQNRKGMFTYRTLLTFREALGKLIVELTGIYKDTTDIIDEIDIEQKKVLVDQD